MLLVAQFENKKHAQVYANYLSFHGVINSIEYHDGMSEVWIERNEQLQLADQLLVAFKANPDGDEFKVKVKQPRDNKTAKLKAIYKKNFKSSYQIPYMTWFLVSVSVIFFLIYLQNRYWYVHFYFLIDSWSDTITQPWRLFTPMFLHFSFLHILFNAWWMIELGGLIEKKEKRWFYLLLITVSSLSTNLLQFIVEGSPLFGGLSGVVYALFGYLWISSKYNPMSGYWMRQDVVIWMLGWFVLGFTGYIGYIANYGHLGGLLAGIVFALVRCRKQFFR